MALQISRPASTGGRQAAQYPSLVTIDAQALFQMLSHAQRRQGGEARVIGTLVGVRNDDGSEVQVKTAYIVPISETEDEVNIDSKYHREMYQMVRKTYPDSVILGWYATSPVLNNLSALIHDFYSQDYGSSPYPAIHLTLETTNPERLSIKTYISTSVGVPNEIGNIGNCIFLPIANSVSYTEVDKAVYSLVSDAAEDEERLAPILSAEGNLDNSITELLGSLDRVLEFVQKAREDKSSSPVVQAAGRELFRVLSSQSSDSLHSLVKGDMRDLLSTLCLTKSLRSQLQVTSELTTLI